MVGAHLCPRHCSAKVGTFPVFILHKSHLQPAHRRGCISRETLQFSLALVLRGPLASSRQAKGSPSKRLCVPHPSAHVGPGGRKWMKQAWRKMLRAWDLPRGGSYFLGQPAVSMWEPGPAFAEVIISQGKLQICAFMCNFPLKKNASNKIKIQMPWRPKWSFISPDCDSVLVD